MRRLLLFLLFAWAPPAASAQTGTPVVEVQLSSFDYTPEDIRLRAGTPVEIRLINTSNGGHNFSAPEFFAAAQILPGGSPASIDKGAIELASGRSATVRLVPARGRYRLRCTHMLHSALGMRGQIIVE